MFIIWWGTTVQRKSLGFRADFCPICRTIKPFRFSQLEKVSHVYGIPSGVGEFSGYSRTCTGCSLEFSEPSIAPETLLSSAEELMSYPDVERAWARRLEIERHREQGRLTTEERAQLLREPFELLEPMASAAALSLSSNQGLTFSSNVKSIAFLWPALLLLSAGAGLKFGVGPKRRWDAGPNLDWLGPLLMGIGTVLLVVSLYSFYTAVYRRVREVIHPFLVRALYPLAPTLEELRAILAERRAARTTIGKRLNARALHLAIATDNR